MNELKPAEYWLRCGQCLHFVTCDTISYWCVNAKCPQCGKIELVSNAKFHNQIPALEVA